MDFALTATRQRARAFRSIMAVAVVSAVLAIPATTKGQAARTKSAVPWLVGAKPAEEWTDRFPSAETTFTFHQEQVLGTSMDLAVATADRKTAQACEKAVLDEIERLAGILSTYEPASEISRLSGSGGYVKVSKELAEVLAAAQAWQQRSGGVFNIQVSAMAMRWREAERTGQLPTEQQLAAIARQIEKPAFELDATGSRARRVARQAVTVDALAKGYIIEKAVVAGRKACPNAAGILLNIGGDLYAWGSASPSSETPWVVGVANPRHRQDNAAPLVRVRLRNQGIATSGPYARGYRVAERHYSHIIDPRSGQPAEAIISATAVASDAMTADVLATCLNVLPPAEGLRLLAGVQGVEGLIVTANGKEHRSPGWAALEASAAPASRPATLPAADPVRKELVIDLQLLRPARGRYMRPYVAVWIEDSAGKPVATVAVWGHKREYQKTLTTWWKIARQNPRLVESISRATRPAGAYSLSWLLTDDQAKPVPLGTYSVCIEVNRERGGHVTMRGSIDCRDRRASTVIRGNAEVADVTLTYGRDADEK
ncbi:MAG: DUF2271 domain-containing protein [Phycisphaerae bacterium]|nr:DUF2271 domain-containing protein [Phycisphaerae bacterium]